MKKKQIVRKMSFNIVAVSDLNLYDIEDCWSNMPWSFGDCYHSLISASSFLYYLEDIDVTEMKKSDKNKINKAIQFLNKLDENTFVDLES